MNIGSVLEGHVTRLDENARASARFWMMYRTGNLKPAAVITQTYGLTHEPMTQSWNQRDLHTDNRKMPGAFFRRRLNGDCPTKGGPESIVDPPEPGLLNPKSS